MLCTIKLTSGALTFSVPQLDAVASHIGTRNYHQIVGSIHIMV